MKNDDLGRSKLELQNLKLKHTEELHQSKIAKLSQDLEFAQRKHIIELELAELKVKAERSNVWIKRAKVVGAWTAASGGVLTIVGAKPMCKPPQDGASGSGGAESSAPEVSVFLLGLLLLLLALGIVLVRGVLKLRIHATIRRVELVGQELEALGGAGLDPVPLATHLLESKGLGRP